MRNWNVLIDVRQSTPCYAFFLIVEGRRLRMRQMYVIKFNCTRTGIAIPLHPPPNVKRTRGVLDEDAHGADLKAGQLRHRGQDLGGDEVAAWFRPKLNM